MNYQRAITLLGFVIPGAAAVLISGVCVYGFITMFGTLSTRMAAHREIETYREKVAQIEAEAQFLAVEWPRVKSLYQMGSFLSQVKQASSPSFHLAAPEETLSITAHDNEKAEAKILKFEGLSGFLVSEIGGAFKKYPPVFADTWQIRLAPDENKLVMNVTAFLAPMEVIP